MSRVLDETRKMGEKEIPNNPAVVRRRRARRHLEAGPALCSEVIALLGQRSGSGPLSSPYCFAVVRVVVVFSRLCVHFYQCFYFFSPLCSCVGQALLGRIKIVSVTASFLMKNVLRLILTSQSN